MKVELLTCCRTAEELAQLEKDIESGNTRTKRTIQSNLVSEKAGYRCTTCGKLYPIMEALYNGVPIDLKATSKPLGRRQKCKKAAQLFRGDHYYAIKGKTLQRYDIDPAGTAALADETPIMGSHLSESDSTFSAETLP